MNDNGRPVKVVVTKPPERILGELVVTCIILFIFWRVVGSPSVDDMVRIGQDALGFLANGGASPAP